MSCTPPCAATAAAPGVASSGSWHARPPAAARRRRPAEAARDCHAAGCRSGPARRPGRRACSTWRRAHAGRWALVPATGARQQRPTHLRATRVEGAPFVVIVGWIHVRAVGASGSVARHPVSGPGASVIRTGLAQPAPMPSPRGMRPGSRLIRCQILTTPASSRSSCDGTAIARRGAARRRSARPCPARRAACPVRGATRTRPRAGRCPRRAPRSSGSTTRSWMYPHSSRSSFQDNGSIAGIDVAGHPPFDVGDQDDGVGVADCVPRKHA